MLPVEDLKQKQREALNVLIEKLGSENLGDYLEFGVFSGTSLWCMYEVLKELKLDHIRLFGFDSFEGMPEVAETEDEGTWQPGQFKFGIEFTKEILNRKGISWDRVLLTKGWYSDTLIPEFLHQHTVEKASVIMLDCDLYSSTQEVLKFCLPLMMKVPTVMFFDDWHSNELAAKSLGEKKAFDEFLQEHPYFTVEEFGTYACHAACFTVTPSLKPESVPEA